MCKLSVAALLRPSPVVAIAATDLFLLTLASLIICSMSPGKGMKSSSCDAGTGGFTSPLILYPLRDVRHPPVSFLPHLLEQSFADSCTAPIALIEPSPLTIASSTMREKERERKFV